MDTYITKNLPQIVRLSQASPKVSVEVVIKHLLHCLHCDMLCQMFSR